MTLEQHPDPAGEARRPLHAVPAPQDAGAGDGPPDPLSVARSAQEGGTPTTPVEEPRHAAGETGGQDPVVVLRAALDDPVPLPDYVEYHSGSLPRLVLGGLFVVVVVVAVVALFWAVSASSALGVLAAAALGAAAGMLFWSMLEWAPTVVSLSQGLLEVSRGDEVDRVDLRSAGTRVDLGADVRSRRWRAVVSRPGTHDLVIRRHQVHVPEFVRIVEQHRRHATGA